MLIHPWDAALDPAEWRDWLASTDRFGSLVVNNLDPAQAPLVIPTHFTLDRSEPLLHLARPNPVWPTLKPPPRYGEQGQEWVYPVTRIPITA